MTPAAGDAILRAVEQSPLAVAMRGELWLYPAVETLHICGFVTLVGAAIMFDMRLFGLSRGLSVRGLAWHLLPWSVAALLVIVPTGLLMSWGKTALVAQHACDSLVIFIYRVVMP